MERFNEVMELLQQKKQAFSLLEQQSEAMLGMEVQELEQAIENRQSLLNQIQKIDDTLKKIGLQWQELPTILNRQRLPENPQEQNIYQLDGEIKAIANRVMQGEKGIAEYICTQKKRIKEKIEKLNKSGYTVAKKYHQSVMTGGTMQYQKKKSRNF